MILVDTIVKMDTVFTEKVNNYMTKGEVIDLFDKVHSFHNDEYSDFIAEIGILITILAIGLGYFNYSKITSIEKRLDTKIKEFDDRIEKTIESKIETKLKIKLFENNELYEKNVKANIIKLDQHHHAHRELIYGLLSFMRGDFTSSLNSYLRSVLKSVSSKQEEVITAINFNLKENKDKYYKVKVKEVIPRKHMSLEGFLLEIEKNLNNEGNLKDEYTKFKDILYDIIRNGDHKEYNKDV